MRLRKRTQASLVAIVTSAVVVLGMAGALAYSVDLPQVFANVDSARTTSVAQSEAR